MLTLLGLLLCLVLPTNALEVFVNEPVLEAAPLHQDTKRSRELDCAFCQLVAPITEREGKVDACSHHLNKAACLDFIEQFNYDIENGVCEQICRPIDLRTAPLLTSSDESVQKRATCVSHSSCGSTEYCSTSGSCAACLSCTQNGPSTSIDGTCPCVSSMGSSPYIYVSKPTSGMYGASSYLQITFSSANAGSRFKIEVVYSGTTTVATTVSSSTYATSLTWSVSSSLSLNYYQIRVTAVDVSNVYGRSAVVKLTPSSWVSFSAPYEGYSIYSGETLQFNWTATSAAPQYIRLLLLYKYSRSSVLDLGTYDKALGGMTWKIPSTVPTGDFWVAVISTTSSSVFGLCPESATSEMGYHSFHIEHFQCSSHDSCLPSGYCDSDGTCSDCSLCLWSGDAFDGQCPSQCGGSTLTLGQFIPNKTESEASGALKSYITPYCPRWSQLVTNTNPLIVFAPNTTTSYPQIMTQRLATRLNILADYVRNTFGSTILLYVKMAYLVPPANISSATLHNEARAVVLTLYDSNQQAISASQTDLGKLGYLAVISGFDWVYFRTASEVYASVRQDLCKAPVDLAFLLDGSGSIEMPFYGGSSGIFKGKALPFVANVASRFDIGPNQTRVSVVTFSSGNTVNFYLNKYSSFPPMNASIYSISYPQGGTQTSLGLQTIRTQIFNETNGARPAADGVTRVLIVITDGQANAGYEPDAQAALLQADGVNIFSIGVGSYVNMDQLNSMATDPDSTHVFPIKSFYKIQSIVDSLSSVACDAAAIFNVGSQSSTTVDNCDIKYFNPACGVLSNFVVEVQALVGNVNVYVSSLTANPGPFNYQYKDESSSLLKSIQVMRNNTAPIYIGVMGNGGAVTMTNTFVLNVWSDLFNGVSVTSAVNITENAQLAQPFFSPPALTVFSGITLNLTYSFVSGNEDGKFSLNAQTGQVSLVGTLDYEAKSSYLLKISAKDKNLACLTGGLNVPINVVNVNDVGPYFPSSSYVANISETTALGVAVLNISAIDADGPALSYSILQSAPSPFPFYLDSNGVFRVNGTLNAESVSQYAAIARVDDNGNPNFYAQVSVQIYVYASPCPAGSSSATGTYPCTQCTGLSYQPNTGATSCLTCGCPSNQYASGTCSSTSNYACQACPANSGSPSGSTSVSNCTCNSNYYNTGGVDTVTCTACTSSCPSGQHLSGSCTPTSNRVCVNCKNITSCTAGQYLAGSCTSNSDYTCTNCTSCQNDQFVMSECSTFANRICGSCTSSCPPGYYLFGSCAGSTSPSCRECPVSCSPNQYLAGTCGGNQTTVCTTCASCPTGTYETTPCTLSSNRQCTSCDTTCNSQQFIAANCTSTSNLQCQQCQTQCPAGSYLSTPCSTYSDRGCTPCYSTCQTCSGPSSNNCVTCLSNLYLFLNQCIPTCPTGYYVDNVTKACLPCDNTCQTCSGASANQCLSCNSVNASLYLSNNSCVKYCPVGQYKNTATGACTTCKTCPSGSFASQTCYNTTDTVCSPWKTCASGLEYETVAPTSSTDRTCATCTTSCSAGFELKGSCLGTSNPGCVQCTEGFYKSQSGAGPCTACTSTCNSTSYLSGTCTAVSTPVCLSCTTSCPLNQYLNGTCGGNSNPQCVQCDACVSGTFESSPCGGSSNRKCSPCTAECPTGYYLKGTCSSSSNPTCNPCTTASQCASNQYLSGTCSGTNYTTCMNCSSACATCFGPRADQCTSCPSGKFLLGTTCVDSCGAGYYGDVSARICRPCDPSCATCNGSLADQCTSCHNSTYLLYGACNAHCPSGYYANDIGNVCQQCSSCPVGSFVTGGCIATTDTVCQNWTQCKSNEFETLAPTSTYNRKCQTCTATCPPGQELVGTCGGTSNPVCASCQSGSFKSSYGNSSCQPCVSSCSSGSYLSGNCTSISSPICITCLSNCSAGSYLSGTCSLSSHPTCKSCTTCTAGQFETQSCSFEHDRNCASCVTSCPTGQALVGECFGTNTTSCQNCTTSCPVQYYLTGTCGGVDGRQLPECTECSKRCLTCNGSAPDQCTSCFAPFVLQGSQCLDKCYDNFYEDNGVCYPCNDTQCLKCNGPAPDQCLECFSNSTLFQGFCITECPEGTFEASNGQCTSCSSCPTGFYKSGGCNGLIDTVCSPWTQCGSYQFEEVAPTSLNNRICQNCTLTCNSGFHLEGSCSAHTNPTCVACSACSNGSFVSAPCVGYDDTTCSLCSTSCESHQFFVSPCAIDKDIVCQNLTVCTPLQYESTAATEFADRQCSALTQCNATSSFESIPPTSFSDRVCKSLTTCTANVQYELTASTYSSDRVCRPLKLCDEVLEYQSVAPTLTTDRSCALLSQCDFANEYISVLSSPTSNRVCSALRVCDYDLEYEVAAPTETSNRECASQPFGVLPFGVEYDAVRGGFMLENNVSVPVPSDPQAYGYVGGLKEGQSGAVRARIGDVSETRSFEVEANSASSVTCIKASLDSLVYEDKPFIRIACQVRDFGSVVRTIDGDVLLVAQTQASSPVQSPFVTCSPDALTGACLAEVELPSEWFASYSSIVVKYRLVSEPTAALTSVGTFQLVHGLDVSSSSSAVAFSQPKIVGFLPTYDLEPGQTFEVTYSLFAAGHALTSFAFTLESSSLISIVSVDAADSYVWRIEARVQDGNVGVAGILTNLVSFSSTPFSQDLVKVVYKLADNADPGTIPVLGAVVSITDAAGKLIVPSSALVSSVPVFYVDRSSLVNNDGNGEVYVVSVDVVGVFAYALNGELYNTAVLDGKVVKSPIVFVLVSNFGELTSYMVSSSSSSSGPAVVCASLNPEILQVQSDCSYLFVDGTETGPSFSVGVYITVTPDGGDVPLVSFPVQVLYPTFPLIVSLADSSLDAVENWVTYNPQSDQCEQQYQRSALKLFSTFAVSSLETELVDVTPYVAKYIRVLDTDIAEVIVEDFEGASVGATLRGLLPGLSSITTSKGWDLDGDVDFEVTNSTVKVTRLDVAPIASLNPSVPSSIERYTPVGLTSSYESDITEFGFYYVHARALFEDGTVMDVTSDMGLALFSLNTTVFDVFFGQYIYTLDDGVGQYLQAVWFNSLDETPCSITQVVATRTEEISINLPEVVGVVPVLTSSLVAYGEDAAVDAPISVPSSVFLGVEVLLDNGGSFVVYQGFGLEVLVVQASSLIEGVFENSVHRFSATGLGFGQVSIEVSLFGFQNSTLLEVVGVETLELVASSYPEGSSMVAITTLSPLGSLVPHVYRQAQMHALAHLSDGSTVFDVTEYTSFSFGPGVDANLVELSGGVVSVLSDPASDTQVPVVGTFSAALFTGEAVLTVSSTPLIIVSFEATFVDTLTGAVGTTASPVITVTFSDSTSAVALTSSGLNLFPGLFLFATAHSSGASVSQSGIVTLEGNLEVSNELSISIPSLPALPVVALSFACNLASEVGDVDFGEQSGIPLGAVSAGSLFEIPVFVNFGSVAGLRDVQFVFQYNASLVQYVSVEGGSMLVGGTYTVISSSAGSLAVSIRLPYNTETGVTHVATLHMAALNISGAATAYYGGVVSSMRNSLGQTVGAPTPRSIVSGQVMQVVEGASAPPQRRRRAAGPTCSVPGQVPCVTCLPSRQTGDANGDCVFDSLDVSFALAYLAESLVNPSASLGLLPSQLGNLDIDLSSVVDIQDVYFLQRADADLVRFVKNVQVVQPTAPNCYWEISAMVLRKGDVPATSSDTVLYFDLGSLDGSFVSDFALSTFLLGTNQVGSKSTPAVARALPVSADGTFAVRIASALQSGVTVGVSVLQVATVPSSVSLALRSGVMFGAGSNPYYFSNPLAISLVLPDMSTFNVAEPSGYNPLLTFVNALSSYQCFQTYGQCNATQYQVSPATLTSSPVCALISACTTGAQYQTTAPTLTTDRLCSPYSTCTAAVQYQSVAGTATTDRVCSNLTACLPSEYQFTAPTATSNRLCAPVTVCAVNVQYQTAAPTATSNRVCAYLTNCPLYYEEVTAPTATSDRVCAPIDYCASSPCQNGGICINDPPGFICNCTGGYVGTFCEIIDVCSSFNPCQNGGICTSTVLGAQCNCPSSGICGPCCEHNDTGVCATYTPLTSICVIGGNNDAASGGNSNNNAAIIAGAVLGGLILLILLILLLMFLARHRRRKEKESAVTMPGFGSEDGVENGIYGLIPIGSFGRDQLYRDFRRVVSFDYLRYGHKVLALSDSGLVYLYRVLQLTPPGPEYIPSMRKHLGAIMATNVDPYRQAHKNVEDAVDFIGCAIPDALVEFALDFAVKNFDVESSDGLYEAFYAAINDGDMEPMYAEPVERDPIYDDANHPLRKKEPLYDSSTNRNLDHIYSLSRNGSKKDESPYMLASHVESDPLYDAARGAYHEVDVEPTYDVAGTISVNAKNPTYDFGSGNRDPTYDMGNEPRERKSTVFTRPEPVYDMSDSSAGPRNRSDTVYDFASGGLKGRSDPTYDISNGNGSDNKDGIYSMAQPDSSCDLDPVYDIGDSHNVDPTYDFARKGSAKYTTKNGAHLDFGPDDIYDNSAELGGDDDDGDRVYDRGNNSRKDPTYAFANNRQASIESQPLYDTANDLSAPKGKNSAYDMARSNSVEDLIYDAADDADVDAGDLEPQYLMADRDVPSMPGAANTNPRRDSPTKSMTRDHGSDEDA